MADDEDMGTAFLKNHQTEHQSGAKLSDMVNRGRSEPNNTNAGHSGADTLDAFAGLRNAKTMRQIRQSDSDPKTQRENAAKRAKYQMEQFRK